jgi:hypothetical protein
MSLPTEVSRDEWRVARLELQAREKAATRARDALNTGRGNLPIVRVHQQYTFEGPQGTVGLADLFDGEPKGRADTSRRAKPDFRNPFPRHAVRYQPVCISNIGTMDCNP